MCVIWSRDERATTHREVLSRGTLVIMKGPICKRGVHNRRAGRPAVEEACRGTAGGASSRCSEWVSIDRHKRDPSRSRLPAAGSMWLGD